MKKMKKLTLFFLVLAGLFVSFNFLNVNAATAPSSIKVKSKSGLYYYSGSTAYISGHKFYRKVLSDGTIAYCVSNNNRKVPAGQTLKQCVKVDFKPLSTGFFSQTVFNSDTMYEEEMGTDISIVNTFTPEDIELSETLYCVWHAE